jgi:hypothetical protein
MATLLYCDVDEEGKIIKSLIGEKIIPMRQYNRFFYLLENEETVLKSISKYRIINGELVLE